MAEAFESAEEAVDVEGGPCDWELTEEEEEEEDDDDDDEEASEEVSTLVAPVDDEEVDDDGGGVVVSNETALEMSALITVFESLRMTFF